VAQAFSMQTELLGMFFSRAGEILQQLEQARTLEESREMVRMLSELLRRRAILAPHLEREVRIMQEIMRRSKGLSEGRGGAGTKGCSLDAIVATELEFMNGDSFFKHRVRKDLHLGKNLPACGRYCPEIHQILGALLENCSQAMATDGEPGEAPEPVVEISCTTKADELILQVSDNGPGLAGVDPERIFAPFYTTRPGRLGLGLYLARKLAERCGGTVICHSVPKGALFSLRLPVKEEEIG
jgi:signal transduction histidine kinase